MNYKVGIVSLGCAKNQVDAEMLLYTLKNRGFIIVNDPADADAVIVNTCGFIESAKQESINEIIELGKLKDEGKIKAIIVTGCLAQRYKSEISEQLYEVDSVIGIGANETIADIVLETLDGQKCESFPDKVCLPLEGGRILSTPPYTAYLKIAEGCDNRCSYCAIPMIRGRFRSRDIEDVVKVFEGHFRNEELFIMKLGYPNCDQHNKEHIDLLKKIKETMIRQHHLEGGISIGTIFSLNSWIQKHFEDEYQKFVNYFCLEKPKE